MITICALHNEPMQNMFEMELLTRMLPMMGLTFRADWLYDAGDYVSEMFPRGQFIDVIMRATRAGSNRIVFIGQPVKRLVIDAEWATWYDVEGGIEIAFLPSYSSDHWLDINNFDKAVQFWKDSFV